MTFETLNDNVLFVELSSDEMEKFHITYDSLNGNNEKTQFALRSLLQKIDFESRMTKGEKVLVEALPTDKGGCFFIFTFIKVNKRRYKVKRNNASLILKTACLDDFLDFVSANHKGKNINQNCEVYQMENCFFLFIPKGNEKLNAAMSEFGTVFENADYERLREYGKSLGNIYLQ